MRNLKEFSTKDLVLDLLYTHQGPMPVQAFCASGEILGIPEQTIRVALNRLCAAGIVERLERGHYGFAQGAQTLRHEVANWLAAESRITNWNGTWIAVHSAAVARSERSGFRRDERALRLRGLRELRRDLWLRPNNLEGGASKLARDLYALGLDPKALVLNLTNLEPQLVEEAVALWEVRELSKTYRKLGTRLEQSMKRIQRFDDRKAGAEIVLVAREIIRQILLDPLLPDSLVPAQPRRDLIDMMLQYQKLGLEIWARLLSPYLDSRAVR